MNAVKMKSAARIASDEVTTVRVMARFGPKLPALVEAQLIRMGNPPTTVARPRNSGRILRWILIVALSVAAGYGLRDII